MPKSRKPKQTQEKRHAQLRYELVELDKILPHPDNWKVHPQYQRDAFREVLSRVGWLQGIVVNERTGRVIDGHLRLEMAMALGEKQIPVCYVSLDEQKEREALVLFDQLSSLADADNDALLRSISKIDIGELSTLGDLVASIGANAQKILSGIVSAPVEDARKQLNIHHATVCRILIAMSDVAVFERALAATGVRNRGEALIILCETYLREIGQHNTDTEMRITPSLSEIH